MAEQENTPARAGKVVQQATVLFAGAEITAVLAEDGYVYRAFPHLCRALGLDGESQRDRIEEQPTLAKELWQFPLAQGKQPCMAAGLAKSGANFSEMEHSHLASLRITTFPWYGSIKTVAYQLLLAQACLIWYSSIPNTYCRGEQG
jgi:hypothetical protein